LSPIPSEAGKRGRATEFTLRSGVVHQVAERNRPLKRRARAPSKESGALSYEKGRERLGKGLKVQGE